MGTFAGVATRRYHALLIAACSPPVHRVTALHSVVDQVELDGRTFELSSHRFGPGASVHPDGWSRLERVDADMPHAIRWQIRLEEVGVEIVRRLSLEHGVNAAELSYTVRAPRACLLRVRPLTPMRSFHDLAAATDEPPACADIDPITVRVDGAGAALTLEVNPASVWRDEPQWWSDFTYDEDRRRGQSCREDIWSPGVFEMAVRPAAESTMIMRAAVQTPVHRGRGVEPATMLAAAAGQFVVARRVHDGSWSRSIIAGYPWFADWGRDAMIALEGLLLVDGRVHEARSVLQTFAAAIHNGRIPNRFDDAGGPAHYNTVDAPLWFVHAVGRLHATSARLVGEDLLGACRSIIAHYRAGTDDGIRMDDDGLITAGSERTQLTWMDAMRDGIVFTPRHGKAVEVNALWFNALLALSEMIDDAGEADRLRELATVVGESFRACFWWPQNGCCHDVLVPADAGFEPDGRIRPNQIFAVSLPHSPLDDDQQRGVVEIGRRRLLTPYGLRTLDPDDPAYCGRYEGDMLQRDRAYHGGTVWPWLIGPYVEALLRVERSSDAARAEASRVLEPLTTALDTGCHGQIAEVYDGDPPHRPSGCPAQAWSVAEVRRAMLLARTEPGAESPSRHGKAV